MSVVLVGPYPPPHGGISVHMQEIHRRLIASRVPCYVLDPSKWPNKIAFTRAVRYATSAGWTLHVHANGHNFKSWILAMLCGSAGTKAAARILTVHSGMAPAYMTSGSWQRKMVRQACTRYHRIICVSETIQQSLVEVGVPLERTEVSPAFEPPQLSHASLDPMLAAWMKKRHPLLSTTLFFRPEYGFDILMDALARLRQSRPSLGCLIMGGDGGAPEGGAQARLRIRSAGLEEHVQLLGDIDHRRCLQLISCSDAFLRPTRIDGDSISVREALALGVPVVASRVGKRPEGALLFDSEDVGGLLAQVERALDSVRPERKPSTGSMDRLIALYQQSSRSRRACA